MIHQVVYFRPGGELNTSEDQVEGLKRLLTEVKIICRGRPSLKIQLVR